MMLKTFHAPEGTVTTQFKHVNALLTHNARSPQSTSSRPCQSILLLLLQVSKLPSHCKGCARNAAKPLRAVSEAKGGMIVREVLSSSQRSASLHRPVDYFHVHASPCCFTWCACSSLKGPPGKGIIHINCLNPYDDCRSKLDRNNDRNFYGRRRTALGCFASPLWHCRTIALDCTAVAHAACRFALGFSITYWHPCLAEIPRLVKHVDESFLQKVFSLTCPPESSNHAIEPDAQRA